VPSPQALVTFVTALFVLLVTTNERFGLGPVAGAALSTGLALALAWIVDRRVPIDDEDEDEITVETKLDVAPHE
jgi:hypothetical protein